MTAGTRKERYEKTNLGLGHRPQNGGYNYGHASSGSLKSWSYDTGLLLNGFERLYESTGERTYFDYIISYFDQFIQEDGAIQGYDPQEQNLDLPFRRVKKAK
ncbi:MAG: glycoside hydrolase family 88 protein [Lachnospiraceae bacterium]|nr:glycoside hydrolase family 88 protein [Lachnospiraceae bacterium]